MYPYNTSPCQTFPIIGVLALLPIVLPAASPISEPRPTRCVPRIALPQQGSEGELLHPREVEAGWRGASARMNVYDNTYSQDR